MGVIDFTESVVVQVGDKEIQDIRVCGRLFRVFRLLGVILHGLEYLKRQELLVPAQKEHIPIKVAATDLCSEGFPAPPGKEHDVVTPLKRVPPIPTLSQPEVKLRAEKAWV
jgi:hypothetical protein